MTKHQEGLLKHSALLFAFTQVANLCNLAFQVVMGRALPTEEYKFMASMLNVLLGIGTALEALRMASAHFAGRANVEGEPGAVKRLMRIWGLRLAPLAVLTLVVGFFGAPPLMRFLHIDSPLPLWLTTIGLVGTLYVPLLAGSLQGLQAFLSMSLSFQGLSIVRLLSGIALVYAAQRVASAGILAHVLGVYVAVATGSLGLWLYVRGKPEGDMPTRGVGRYAAQSFFMLLGFAVVMNLDVLVVLHYLPGDAGLFSYGAMVGRTIIFLPMPIAFAMFPKVVSTGEMTPASRSLLLKAVGMVMGIVLCGVAGCTVLPWLPLKILYGKQITAENLPAAMHNVRIMIWALAPLALTYILMNFEMAQHRFRATPWLLACAVAYPVGVALFHGSVDQIVSILGACSVASALVFIAAVPWRTAAGELHPDGVH